MGWVSFHCSNNKFNTTTIAKNRNTLIPKLGTYWYAVCVLSIQKSIVAKIAKAKYTINLLTGSELHVEFPNNKFKTFLSLSVGGLVLKSSDIEPDIFISADYQNFLLRLSLYGMISFPVYEKNIDTKYVSPLQSLIQNSYNSDINNLLETGYTVEETLTNDNNAYFIAMTRLGDRVAIKLSTYSPHEYGIKLQKVADRDIPPNKTSMISISGNHVCIDGCYFTADTNILSDGVSIYPIIDLQEILANPIVAEKKISDIRKQIVSEEFNKLKEKQKVALSLLNTLTEQVSQLTSLIPDIENKLSTEINHLSSSYDIIKDVNLDTLSNEHKGYYYAIKEALIDKKNSQFAFINMANDVYTSLNDIKIVNDRLKTI